MWAMGRWEDVEGGGIVVKGRRRESGLGGGLRGLLWCRRRRGSGGGDGKEGKE
jgi:hypothetical protein